MSVKLHNDVKEWVNPQVYREILSRFKGSGATANFCLLTDPNTIGKECYDNPCHGSMNVGEDVIFSAVVSNIRGRQNELTDNYYYYLTEISPYRDCFFKWDKKNRTLICNTDTPSNLLVGGLIASRMPWEAIGVVSRFNKFYGKINPDLAFVLSNMSFLHSAYIESDMPTGHNSINAYMSIEDTLAFINNEPLREDERYKSNNTYREIMATFCDGYTYNSRITVETKKKLVANSLYKKLTDRFDSTTRKAEYTWSSPAKILTNTLNVEDTTELVICTLEELLGKNVVYSNMDI